MLSANPRVTRILSGGVTNEREDREGQRRRRNEGLNPKEGNDSFMEMSGGERSEGRRRWRQEKKREREREGTKLLPCCDDEPNLASRRVGGTAEEGVKWRCRSRTRLEGYYAYRFVHLFVAMLPDRDSRHLDILSIWLKKQPVGETNKVPSLST